MTTTNLIRFGTGFHALYLALALTDATAFAASPQPFDWP
jgi:hypothetical protein